MKHLAPALVAAFISTAAHAADAPKKEEPKAPACGKTADECQKVVDGLQAQIQTAGRQFDYAMRLADEANRRFIAAQAQVK